MNLEWATGKLEEYLRLCEGVRMATTNESWNPRANAINQQAELMLHTMDRILQWIDPSDTSKLRPPSYMSLNGEERVRRALGALRDLAELEENMGSTAPELVADRLHPTVWQSAAVTWNTGQYRVAVGQASLALATQIKARAKSRLNDRRLMQEVFSTNSPSDRSPKLHFEGDRDDDTWRSRQEGLHLLAQGAYAGIRNISAHEDEEWSEQQALEYLSVLSVIARWVDETELIEP
ncbi:TIGR02391 family protein [Sinomonas albida]|uniref:TIGR02391 family protein n=1 Tax=Sinomonas albida TaxID=369942 RepID=UPI003015DE79